MNTPENARLTFQHVVNDLLQSTIDSNFKFYKRITDDNDFARFFTGRLFEEYLRSRATDERADRMNDELVDVPAVLDGAT